MKTTKYALAIALGVVALVARPGHADTITTYTINFTLTAGSPAPVSGSFTYDSTHPSFSNFLVTWNGVTLDLTSSANAPTITLTGTGCTGEAATPAYGFAIISQSLVGCSPTYFWGGGLVGTAMTPAFTFNVIGPVFGANDGICGPSCTAPVGTLVSPLANGNWSITPTPVPEPATLFLLGTGLLGLVGRMRRKWLT